MRDDRERLKDILEAIENIEKYADKGKEAYRNNELIQTWILHHLLIMGEAAAKVTDEFQEEHRHIPWSQIVAMRNILVHHYFGIDLEVVWGMVEKDLPLLKDAILQI